MALTTAQTQTLATDLQAQMLVNQALAEAVAANNNVYVRDFYNGPDPSNADCWRTLMSLAEVLKFTVWTEFIGRSQGERDAFRTMLMTGSINPSDPNIRQGFADIFSGPSGVNTKNALTAAAKRKMTRGERLFALNGSGTFTLTFEGLVTSADVLSAFALLP